MPHDMTPLKAKVTEITPTVSDTYRIPTADELPETTSGKLYALRDFARNVIDPERFDYDRAYHHEGRLGCLITWTEDNAAYHVAAEACREMSRADGEYIFNANLDAPDNSLETAIARIEEIARKYEEMGR